MESLLQRQHDIVEDIKKLERNFNKDSTSRKTRKYLDERLDVLDKLWAEFQVNNHKLSNYENDSDPYFTEKQFQQARMYFDSVRIKISSVTPAIETTTPRSTTPKPQPSLMTPEPITMTAPPRLQPKLTIPSTSTATMVSSLDQGQIAELTSLQRTNFRAFHRQVSSLKVDEIRDKWELEDELRNLQTRWNVIDTLHLQIDHALQGTDTQYDNEFYAYESSYKSIKKALNLKLASTVHFQQSTPQIDIPTFTGKYTQWPTFYDLYVESIHNNNLLTKTQKMQHLKGKLRGDAERLIQHLHIAADNYDTAWELLTHRYNNPQLLFTKQIEIFLNQPVAHKQSAYDIRRIFDTSMECIHAIQNLGIDTSTWDPLLVHIIARKLDAETYSDYKEARKSPRDLPSLAELMNFLESKFNALEPINKKDRETSTSSNKPYQPKPFNNKPFKPYHQHVGNHRFGKNPNREFQSIATCTSNCPICNNNHFLYKCNKFIKYSPDERLMTVIKLNFCQNCLYTHNDNQCTSTKRCKVCQKSHNTMLHDAYANMNLMQHSTSKSPDAARSSPVPTAPVTLRPPISTRQDNKQHSVNHVATDNEEILLTTLSIKVKSADGTYVTLRALLDQGSQISLISENAAQMLGLSRQRYHASVSGIGNGSKCGKGVVTLDCQSIYQDYELTTQALVIKHVINNLPNVSFNKRSWPHLQHIQLADPEYNISRPIDLLLDASIYSEIIMSGLIKGPNMAPIAQQTRLGWILSGNVKTFNCHVVINNLSEISQYWELEEISDPAAELTQDEQYCEQYYQTTTRRLENGRYEVAIPMKPGFEQDLGQSKPKAIAQFYNLENKMLKNETFSESYKCFLREYEHQGHMTQVTQQNESPSCYLPHHGVLKIDSTTTKLRTVFNASAKTSSGYSLNDLMERGPNLQKDLQHLILVWRQHKYVITADIEKMFRQIVIRESDQHLQRIMWRSSPHEPLKEYQLTTVTYGTKAAPYLAMRTLKQLALDNAHKFPLAAAAIMSSFYMDDLLEGCDHISQAKQLQQEIIDILKGAGMNIRKWSSNTDLLIQDLSNEQLDVPLDFKHCDNRKTLGLRWIPSSDTFIFKNIFKADTSDDNNITKRQLLSNISKIFDPLGWLSPLTIRAKLLFQRTWSETTADWDTFLSEEINNEWIKLKHDLQNIEKFKINRYLGDKNHYIVHGFCDASEKVYACAIYIITRDYKGEYTSTLVTAKTKLAPLKNKLSLPKLELCGALLLSQLMKKVIETLPKDIQIHAWTDSMVVLGWLHGDVNRWKQFVANRVRKILDVIPLSCWHHVRSEDNSADCATRGLSSLQLSEHTLWWQGPQWLSTLELDKIQNKVVELPELEVKKASVTAAVCHKNDLVLQLLHECSSTRRIITILGWLSRYTQWLRNKQTPLRKYLSSSERKHALNLIIKTVQSIEFEDDIQHLQKHGKLRSVSKLLSLNPYIDSSDGLLKVGGRLNNSLLSQSAQHPIILPSHGKLTELIIQHAHSVTIHGGPRLTLSLLRESYWILSGLRTVKRELRKCVTCRRHKEENKTQLMADLPQPRVTPSRPFTHTGVDFTGHFDIKANKGRGVRTHKGYVAVFVCLATKAVHLELVSDLSTPGFLAAFRRFCARRSVPKHVYSDQGRNFIGANKVLKKEYKDILETINGELLDKINELDIQWHFNAPAYPSAGGLWEAAVKSLKHHLRRVIGDQKLTYEEFITLLHQIEACLNSRPLLSLTESPDDEYLSPGHFLVGGPLISRPQTDPDHMTLTTRWQMIQTMNKQFWKKWSSDYLQQLQVRTKWRTPSKNIEVNDIVLVKDENLPPGKWMMGRIIDVHPGSDGYVRVVSVKTKNGVMKRPIVKLSPLLHSTEPTQEQTSDVQSSTCDDVTSETTSDRPRPRRTTRKPLGTLYTMAMMLFMFLFTPAQCSYNISTLNANQNIYFDKMYDMNIIRDEWNLIVYYNMSTYWSALRHVHNYVGHLETYLHTTVLPTQYKSIIFQLQHELSEIEHYNKILKIKAHRRQKRGLVDGVGYVANSLFGILDERFAKKYEKDIEKISMNENHLQLLLKNQTSVIEAQYNILQRNEAIMNKQFGMVQKCLQDITLNTNRMEKQTTSELHILSSSISAMIIISNIRNMQESVIDTVTDLAHGHMDTHLLPPEQLEEQLNIVYSHIPNDLTLPADKHDLKELYKLMKISGDIGSSYLIIEIKIPLVNKEAFELDKVISLPQETFYVEFIAPYIAFNLQRDLLLTLTESDIQNCIHTRTNKLLCSIDKPIYELRITQAICNLSIHNKTMCSATQAPCRERWIKLHSDNKWLFSCCGKCTVRIFCTDIGMTIKSLNGNGLLEIGQGCTIKSDTFSIHGHNNYLSHVKIQKDIPTLSASSILNSMFNFTEFEKFTFAPEDHDDEWRRMKTEITTLKKQADAPLSVHDVHQYSVMYTILGLIIVAVIGYVIVRWRKRKTTLSLLNSPTDAIPMEAVRSVNQDTAAAPAPPRTRPRSVRLDIPDTSVVQ